jgi:hypothetical protein
MLIPKSIKFHDNLTEAEVRAYYSLKPLDEDHEDHAKRFNKILNDYVNTRDYPSNNARLCFKKQLKRMIKEGKTDTPKFEAFNMWRLQRIQYYISKQKDYLLQREGKEPMPKRKPNPEADKKFSVKMNELIGENKTLKEEIENLKKQLQDKDNQIDYLMAENSKMKYMPQEVEEAIHEIKECLIESSEEESEEEVEEEVVEEVVEKPKPIVVHFDTEEEDSSSEEEEEEEEEEEKEEEKETNKIPYSHREFYKIRNIFYDICNKKAQPYHDKYMSEGKNMNDKDRRKLKTQLTIDYVNEVVEVEIEKLDNQFEVPTNVYSDIFEGAEEKLQDKFNYYGFDNED